MLEETNRMLRSKFEVALVQIKELGVQYIQVAKDKDELVYHTQPNVDSAISQDTSLIVLTLMYMNVRNVSVVWPFWNVIRWTIVCLCCQFALPRTPCGHPPACSITPWYLCCLMSQLCIEPAHVIRMRSPTYTIHGFFRLVHTLHLVPLRQLLCLCLVSFCSTSKS